MGLFDAFKKNEPRPFDIFNLFEVDIRKLKKKDFILEADDDPNSMVMSYTYDLPFKVLDIFDTLSYFEFSDGTMKTYQMYANALQQLEMNKFINFIDTLYKNLGDDDNGNKIFDKAEIASMKSMKWKGRSWQK